MRVSDVAVVKFGLEIYARRREECIKSRKPEIFWSYLSRSALKTANKITQFCFRRKSI